MGTTKNFRWRGKMYHLTYKGHIRAFDLLDLAEKELGKLLAYSVVWEAPEKKGVREGLPYNHTHFLFWLVDPPDKIGERKMDYKDVHPNIQTRSSKKWFWHVYKIYHWKDPVGPIWNEEIPQWEPLQHADEIPQDMAAEAIDIALAAPTLADACKELEIVPKSVSDVHCVRQNNKRKWTPMEIEFTENWIESDVTKQIDEWFRTAKKGVRGNGLLVIGRAKLGKTEYVRYKAGEHAVYMKGRMNWQKWLDNPDPSYLIIDDVPHDFTREQRKNFLGINEFESNPKYGKIATMTPLPTICCDNTGWAFDQYDEDNWTVVRVEEKMYHPEERPPPLKRQGPPIAPVGAGGDCDICGTGLVECCGNMQCANYLKYLEEFMELE